VLLLLLLLPCCADLEQRRARVTAAEGKVGGWKKSRLVQQGEAFVLAQGMPVLRVCQPWLVGCAADDILTVQTASD
jgi:hypothetical protein